MKILKFKKIGVDKYKVVFENNELILYEDIILKYNLISKNSISLEELEKILDDNKYAEMYHFAIKYISIKMRSKKEIENYLLKKECNFELIDSILEKLENNGFINDKKYIEAYVNDSVNLKNIGPYKIKDELMNLDFDESLIDIYLNNIDENIWINKIEKYISKIKSNKKYSNNMLHQKILNDLYIKGFDKELIYPLLENIILDDTDNLKKEYEKAYKKYSKTYDSKELSNKIVSYLQRKGYEYKDIFEVVKK